MVTAADHVTINAADHVTINAAATIAPPRPNVRARWLRGTNTIIRGANSHSFDDMTVMVIEQLHVADSVRRRQRESYWIYTLRTMTPDGLNLES